MGRAIGTLTLACLLGCSLCAANGQKQKAPPFESAQAVSAVQTEYPMMSLGFGTVILQVAVDEEGAVRNVKVIHGIPSLTEEAERSMRQWKFKPAELNGKPLASSTVASFTFSRSAPVVHPLTAESQSPEETTPQYQPIQVVSTVRALYPEATPAFGTVILRVTVDEASVIGNIKVIHGIPSLTEEAERSVRQWKFKPAELNGRPVASTMVASFIFSHSPIYSHHP